MSHVAVTLEFDHTTKDLALPLDVTVHLLIESLVEALHLKRSRDQRYGLSIKTEQGLRPIPLNATLAEANIVHGTVLTLLLQEQRVSDHASQTGAYLQAQNGRTFPLANRLTLIGRNDAKSGIFVDVDLRPLVTDHKIISRRHAQIEQEGERYYLTDLVSTNGTKLNGQRIPPREKCRLRNGDIIEFGRDGAQMTFVGAKE
jgi:uncharacterized ubiquitin-like protein YukD